MIRKRSWLVQQLCTPMKGKMPNPFTNIGIGLTESAQKEIHKVFTTNYMGAAEFEWGAFQETLSDMWDSKDLVHEVIEFYLHDITEEDLLDPNCGPPIKMYYVGNSQEIDYHVDCVRNNLNRLISSYEKYDTYVQITKADHGTMFRAIYDISDDNGWSKDESIKGWLCFDNHYAVFLDDKDGKTMSKRFFRLFRSK
jgi:hypothetical protein|tara:strand:+ start:1798 stop:2385 length:588 start_codon:yes stop_codon:yes gene_type:complete